MARAGVQHAHVTTAHAPMPTLSRFRNLPPASLPPRPSPQTATAVRQQAVKYIYDGPQHASFADIELALNIGLTLFGYFPGTFGGGCRQPEATHMQQPHCTPLRRVCGRPYIMLGRAALYVGLMKRLQLQLPVGPCPHCMQMHACRCVRAQAFFQYNTAHTAPASGTGHAVAAPLPSLSPHACAGTCHALWLFARHRRRFRGA